MKFIFGIAASMVLLPAFATLSAPSSADYQTAIREATENSRDDGNGVFSIRRDYFYGSFTRDICDKYLSAFTDYPITRRLLDTLTPNQPMKLTATAQRFGDASLEASFLSPQIGLSPSGRSLSFSR